MELADLKKNLEKLKKVMYNNANLTGGSEFYRSLLVILQQLI